MLVAAGLQDSSNWGVPDSGILHDQGQEELPAPQPPCHGLCLPLQAGQPPALLSLGTHASFAVHRATYCSPCWVLAVCPLSRDHALSVDSPDES